jgi:hypothetical protein
LAANKTYPVGHPNISSLFCSYDLLASLRLKCISNVSTFHGNIDTLLSSPFTLPSYHPSIPAMFNAFLPAWHPNLTSIILRGAAYPAGHPKLESMVCRYLGLEIYLKCSSAVPANTPLSFLSFSLSFYVFFLFLIFKRIKIYYFVIFYLFILL